MDGMDGWLSLEGAIYRAPTVLIMKCICYEHICPNFKKKIFSLVHVSVCVQHIKKKWAGTFCNFILKTWKRGKTNKIQGALKMCHM